MTTPDPAARARDALRRTAADRSGLWATVRVQPWTWLVLPVIVAGWDAGRALSLPFLVALVVVPLALATVGAATRPLVARTPDPASRWILAAGSMLLAVLLLVLVGAGRSAVLLLTGGALLAGWTGLRPLLAGGPHASTDDPPRPRAALVGRLDRAPMRAAVASGEALLVPTLLAITAGAAGALLPAADPSTGGDPRSALPWAWLLAYGAWLVGRRALEEAAVAPPPRARRLGRVAVAGQVVSIVLALTQEPLGSLAALGLAAGLLPSVMAALGSPGRALREARVLDRLLVAWFAVLLLVAWGVLRFDPWQAAVLLTAAATGYLLVAIGLAWLFARRRRPRDADAATLADPSLVIILPLDRNVPDLRPLVLALRSQTYADTRIVVAALPGVDRSVADEWLGGDAVLDVPPPPPGWAPQAWARHVALVDDVSTAELALIVDDRTVLAPVAARVLVEHARATRVDAVGAIPRNALPTLDDRLAGAGPTLWRFGWEPRWLVALTRGRPARIVGPDPALLLVRVGAYRAMTGATATGVARGVPPDGTEPVPSDGLTRRLADDGRRVGIVQAADLAVRRGERGVQGALAWWRSMAVPMAGGSIADTLAMLLLVLLGWVAPVVLPLVALLGSAPPRLVALSLLPLLLLVAARGVLAATQRSSVRAIVWHPVMAGVAVLGIALALADVTTDAPPEAAADDVPGARTPLDPVVQRRT